MILSYQQVCLFILVFFFRRQVATGYWLGRQIGVSQEHIGRYTEGGFFSESEIRFSNLPISQIIIPKNYPELEI